MRVELTGNSEGAFTLVDDAKITEAMELIAKRLESTVKQNIMTGGRPNKWPGTLRGNPPYRLSGNYMTQINLEYDASHARVWQGTGGMRHPAIPFVLQFGAVIRARNAPYLVFKIGSRVIKTKQVFIPPRPLYVLQQEDIDYIKGLIEDAVIMEPKQERIV